MGVLTLFVVVLSVVASLLLVLTAGLLIYRDRRNLDLLVDRLRAEQRIDTATRATLQAMRDAARQHTGN